MQRSAAFKKGYARIAQMEKHLDACKEQGRCEKMAEEAKEEIEEHFAKSMNALAARKDALLREISLNVAAQKQRETDTRTKLETSIRVCKQTMEAAEAMHGLNPSAGEAICKELEKVPALLLYDSKGTIELPASLFEAIQTHGKVSDFGRFSVAEEISTLGLFPDHPPTALLVNPHNSCLYVCSGLDGKIKTITMQGVQSTFTWTFTTRWTCPIGIAMNYLDNTFFITCRYSHKIFQINSLGEQISIIGGSQDGIGDAQFNSPWGITIDQQTGNLFVCECSAIRKITPQGVVSTIAGQKCDRGFADGNGTDVKFNRPRGICFDQTSQSLLVCDYGNNRLRRVRMNGDVSTLCKISRPYSVAIANNQSILVAAATHQILKVSQIGKGYEAIVIAGSPSGKLGEKDGKPEEATFSNPLAIAVHEPSHSCFVVDGGTGRIRKISFSKEG